MLSSRLHIYHDSEKNQKLRQMAWITNTIEDDPQVLEEMFWPTDEERKIFRKKNADALAWLKEHRRGILMNNSKISILKNK